MAGRGFGEKKVLESVYFEECFRGAEVKENSDVCIWLSKTA